MFAKVLLSVWAGTIEIYNTGFLIYVDGHKIDPAVAVYGANEFIFFFFIDLYNAAFFVLGTSSLDRFVISITRV